MRLTYETGIGTLIQFVLLSFLNILTAIGSVSGSCHNGTDDCVSNLITSMLYYLLIACWFGFLWMLGYTAQARRSKQLARILIVAEAFVALIAFFNAKHHTAHDSLGLLVSIVDVVIALWVITLAFRLMRAKGGRVVSKHRARRRPSGGNDHVL